MNKKAPAPSKGAPTQPAKGSSNSPPKGAPSKGSSPPKSNPPPKTQPSAPSKGPQGKGAPGKGASGNQIAELAAQHHISEAEVTELKQAFDLFDTDQGGSIDIKGKLSFI